MTLPEEVKNLVKNNKISMGHARTLSKLEDSSKIIELANKIIDENMNVRMLEHETKKEDFTKKVKQQKKEKSSEFLNLERELSEYLGTKINLTNKKLEISYENENDLNRILEIIKFNK